jgi:hypothetical protein
MMTATTANRTNGQATSTPICTTPKKRGFKGVPCLACGEEMMRVYFDDLTTFSCGRDDCGTEFTLEEIRERIDGWNKVLAFFETAPEIDE